VAQILSRRNKLILAGLLVLVFAAVLGIILAGGSGDIYGDMRLRASTQNIVITLNIEDNNGIARPTGGNFPQSHVTIRVEGAPNSAAERVFVHSLDPSVATAAVTGSSGNQNRVTITAVNGGRTRIRVLSGGGGRTMYLDVRVDVPARSMNMAEDVRFGIVRGAYDEPPVYVPFSGRDFNFFATQTVGDLTFNTTENEVTYQIIGQNRGTHIDGQRLVVPWTSLAGPVTVRATLTRTGATLDFPVYIFAPFGDITLTNENAPTRIDNLGNTFASLVLNAPSEGEFANQFTNFIDYRIAVDGWDIRPNFAGDFGPGHTVNFHYRLVGFDETVVFPHLDTPSQDIFRLEANGLGQTFVTVMVFPVVNVGQDTPILFNRPRDTHLHEFVQIRVEVRNIFHDLAPDGEKNLEFHRNGTELDQMLAFYSPTRTDRFHFNVNLRDQININTTNHHQYNNRLTFELINSPAHANVHIGFMFDITWSTRPVHDPAFDIIMSPLNFSQGIPYYATFSMSMRPSMHVLDLIESNDLILRVRSVAAWPDGTPLAYRDIPLRAMHAVSEMSIEDAAGNPIDILFPVRGYVNGAFEFFVRTDIGYAADVTYFADRLGESAFIPIMVGEIVVERIPMFVVHHPSGFEPDGRLRFLLEVNPRFLQPMYAHLLNQVSLGVHHGVTIEYISGMSVDVRILVQERLASLGMNIQNVTGGQVFETRMQQVGIVNQIERVFLRIDGVYQLNLSALPSHASVWATLTATAGLDVDTENFTFTPRTEGTMQLIVDLHAHNPRVLSALSSTMIIIYLEVINPLISAEFDRNWETLFSRGTVSHFAGLPLPGNFVDFSLDLTFARGTESDVDVHINPNWPGSSVHVDTLGSRQYRIHGLTATSDFIFVAFDIHQTYTYAGGTFRMEFTFNAPMRFFVRVVDASTVQMINTLDIGNSLNMVITDGPATRAVRLNTFPANAHNPRIGFAFEQRNSDGSTTIYDENGMIITEVRDGAGNLIVSVSEAGVITAHRSNVGINVDLPVVLRIFAFDSIRRTNNGEGELLLPATYLRFSIFIFDQRSGEGQFMISNRDEFLLHFGYTFDRYVDLPSGRYRHYRHSGEVIDGYFRLVDNIDFHDVILQPINQFVGQFIGTRTYAVAGGDLSARYELQNMRFESATNWQTMSLVGVGHSAEENFGLFGRLGDWNGFGEIDHTRGLVDGIAFTNVLVNIMYNRSPITQYQEFYRTLNFGVVAGVNMGTITDVTVEVNFGQFTLSGHTDLNWGAIAGINMGYVTERYFLNVTGAMAVSFGSEQANHVAGARTVFNINLGGFVGRNMSNGTIRGRNAGGVLSDNVALNSEIALLIISAQNIVRNDVDKNVGGVVARNEGLVEEISTQNVLYNATRGLVGGLVGLNMGTVNSAYSTSAIYARGVLGGIVGRNTGTVRNSYFDFFINPVLREQLNAILTTFIPRTMLNQHLDWTNNPFYAGLIVGRDANINLANFTTEQAAHVPRTVIGGVVGINSGDIFHSFASSVFTNTTHTVMGIPYRGDIFIFGARGSNNVIVGGVIGVQENPRTEGQANGPGRRSRVEGVFSALSIHYMNGGERNSPIIGGLIGELHQTANVDVVAAYSYNYFRMNTHPQDAFALGGTNAMVISPKVGINRINNSNPTHNNTGVGFQYASFVLTYAILAPTQVDWVTATGAPAAPALIITENQPVGFNASTALPGGAMPGGSRTIEFIGARYGRAAVTGATGGNMSNWVAARSNISSMPATDEVFNADDFFVNFQNINVPIQNGQVGRLSEAAFTAAMGFDFPMIRQSEDYEMPLFIARPQHITFALASQEQLTERFTGARNNRGGFNYAIVNPSNLPHTSSLVIDGTRVNSVALMFTAGPVIPSAVTANRYYLDDLFSVEISPLIASRRMFISIEGGSGIAELGRNTVGGVPRYFLNLRRTGSFQVVAISTRTEEGQSVLGRLAVDVIPGVTTQTVSRDILGMIARRSMLTDDPNNFTHNFEVQKGTTFSLLAAVDNQTWQVEGSYIFESGAPRPYQNGSPIYFHEAPLNDEPIIFRFRPFISWGGNIYHLDSLVIEIEVEVYAGAIYLELFQDGTTIDGSTASVYSGRFVTDILPTVHRNVAIGSLTELQRAEQLLSLTNFAFSAEGTTHQMFGLPVAGTPNPEITRTVIEITENDRAFNLVFELHVRPIEVFTIYVQSPGGLVARDFGYREYNFDIYMRLEIREEVYNNFLASVDVSQYRPPVAIPHGISGTIHMAERSIDRAENELRPLLYDSADVEVVAQQLQSVNFQHYANTITVPGSISEFILPPNQPQSMNVYTERDGTGGILKVYAHPFYSGIDQFTLRSIPVNQIIGEIDGENVYKYWDIMFIQMVFNPYTGYFENYPGVPLVLGPDGMPVVPDTGAPGEILPETFAFHQVSTVRDTAGGRMFSWEGVYYIHTVLRERNEQANPTQITQGQVFHIEAEFITLGDWENPLTREFELFALDRPGLNFEFDNVPGRRASQAVGTTSTFTVNTTGVINVDWGSGAETEMTIFRGGSNIDPYQYVTLTHIPNTQSYQVTIAPSVNMVGATIFIEFSYELEQSGLILQMTTTLEIDVVLMRVDGLYLAGRRGNTIHMNTPSQYNVELAINASHHSGHDAPELAMMISNEIARVQYEINRDPRVEWTGRSATGGWMLNVNWDEVNEFYHNEVGPTSTNRDALNFFLGSSRTSGIKFVSPSVRASRTNVLSVRMSFELIGGLYQIRVATGMNITADFNVVSVPSSAEDNPVIIRTAQELRDAASIVDGHFILMPDDGVLTLNGWEPLEWRAASLDGNNTRIILNSFNIPEETTGPINIGLFSTVHHGSLIKNVNLVLPFFPASGRSDLRVDLTHLPQNATVRVGAFAGVNQGILTNIAVLSGGASVGTPNAPGFQEGQFTRNEDGNMVADFNRSNFDQSLVFPGLQGSARSRLAVFMANSTMDLRVGGLVGINMRAGNNYGVISNSRVLIDMFVGREGAVADETQTNVGQARVAGFAAQNDGFIVSSFFRDGNIINRAWPSSGAAFSWTAGFVAQNGQQGIVRGSYVMGATSGLASNGQVTRGVIRSTFATAGFVFQNAGLVEDGYVNILLPEGTFRSGFVENNTAQGVIRNSIVQNPNPGGDMGAYFVFARAPLAGGFLGTLTNNRFMNQPGFIATNDFADGARFRGFTNPIDINEFEGFSISAMYEDRNPNVWRMTPHGPRLVGADHIAVSIRVMGDTLLPTGHPEIIYHRSHAYGTRYNPIVIWTGDQFNRHIYLASGAEGRDRDFEQSAAQVRDDWEDNVFMGYMRLVSNISVRAATGGTATQGGLSEFGGVLHTYKVTFQGELDGNGLGITDISLVATEAVATGLRSVGLFSRLTYATVKNVNLSFVPSPGAEYSIAAASAPFVGGLAGIAVNSNIVDVNVINQTNHVNTRILGFNIVGGVVGVSVNFDYDTQTAGGSIVRTAHTYKIENVHSNVPVMTFVRHQAEHIDLTFASAIGGLTDLGYMQHDLTRLGIAGGVVGMVTHDVGNIIDRGLFMRDIDGNAVTNAHPMRADFTNVRMIGNFRNPNGNVGFGIVAEGEVVGSLIGVIGSEISVRGAEYLMNNTLAVTHNHLRAKFYAGGIVGINFGRLDGATVSLFGQMNLNIQSNAGARYIFFGTPAVSRTYGMFVGGIAGFNSGTINNATLDSPMTAEGTGGTHPIRTSQKMSVGGIVGENAGGTISNSRVERTILGGFMLGGVVGMNRNGGALINNHLRHTTGTGAYTIFNVTGAQGVNSIWGGQADGVQINETFRGTPEMMSAFGTGPIADGGRGSDMVTFTGGIVGYIQGADPIVMGGTRTNEIVINNRSIFEFGGARNRA